jgi:acyl-CoA synthetase (AMP-forming)/AMP-acid ligase II/aryl carrier-like protein
MTAAETLVDLLIANRRVDRHIGYLEAEQKERRVTFAELHERALGILRRLQRVGAARGDRLIIFLNNNEAFVDGFWAALAGGIVPVPLAVGISDEHRWKLLRIARLLDRPWFYTDRKGLAKLEEFAALHGEQATGDQLRERAFLIDEIEDAGRAADPVSVRPGDLAFIQYSSGSTSQPKGVQLTHGNVLANVRSVTVATGWHERDVSVSWMPLTHDLGLIGFFIMMFANRVQLNLMPTDLFVRRPLLWTTFLSRKRATLTASPNFGYRHYLKVLGDRPVDGIDLSAVRQILNGAEPISVELCDEFMQRLAPAGLAREAMYPVYGLAEATVGVTVPVPGRRYRSLSVDRHRLRVGDRIRELAAGDPAALTLMQVGSPIPDTELRIVDDRNEPVAEDCVGHIQVRGGNVTAGYYQAPEATAAAFGPGGWLRTGDLGFMHAGELVIAGRDKEIIFVNGQNYFPHDLEAIAQTAPGLELGKVAAAGCRPAGADTESLVLFVLHRGSLEEFLPIAREVTRRVNEHAGLEVATVVPIRRMPKTTSGKIRRVALEQAYLAGEFDTELTGLARLRATEPRQGAAAADRVESRIQGLIDELLPDKRVQRDDNLFEIGVSSLALVQIHERLDREFPGRVELSELFDHPTISALARHLEAKLAAESA